MLTVFYPLAVVRWIHFTSMFVLFGSSFFWFYMGAERFSAGPGGLPRALRATIILLRVAAPLAAISGIAWLAFILINSTDDISSIVNPEDLRLYFFETPFGTVSMVRIMLLVAAVVVAFLPWTNRSWFSALLHIAAVLLISQAWLGHAAEGGTGLYGDIMVTVYSTHVIAAAAWVGGLPPLLFALVDQRLFGPNEAASGASIYCSLFLNGDGGGNFDCRKRHRQRGLPRRGLVRQALRHFLWECAVHENRDRRRHARLGVFQPFHCTAKAARRVAEGHGTNQ